ncbi:MAG TPA: sensor domain-containing protein [Gammaproteobacteria bacterium]|nr:sensor domain-containing protein [Gammaproteobacteria bacterium]
MTEQRPRNIEEYLAQLRAALAGEDPALIQDAMYDAEEYLRAEINAHLDRPQSEVIADIVRSYGAPDEVADIYRKTEATVEKALATPKPVKSSSVWGRFFGVYADVRSWSSLFYMLLAGATGWFYFTWTITGWSVSLGLLILIIGIPLLLLFMGATRLLSLLEGRLVEVMLQVRMPRRPVYQQRDLGLFARIGNMLSDGRTWSTFCYMILMLPLGIIYFTIVVTGLSIFVPMVFAPTLYFGINIDWGWYDNDMPYWATFFVSLLGILGLTVFMHLVRGIGHVHGQLAKSLLVRVEPD